MALERDDSLISYERYYHDGFIVELYEDDNGRDAWIYRDGMAVKQFMFGFGRDSVHFDRFHELVEENLEHYENDYRRLYMY